MSLLDTVGRDARLAARTLRKTPLVTLVAVLVIALGTGAVTTIFSAVNALLLRPLPGAAEPERLVDVERTQADGSGSLSASHPYYQHLRQQARTVQLAAWGNLDLTIAAGGEGALAASGTLVSGSYFEVLGVRPALGRFFTAAEDGAALAHPVLVVSHDFWQSRLGGDRGVLGSPVRVNGHPFTVVGVAPPGFQGVFTPRRTDAWAPLAMQPALRPRRDREDPAQTWLRLFGRLEEGVGPEAARQELAALTAAFASEAAEPQDFRPFTGVALARLTGLPADAHRAATGFLGLLLAAAGLVLLIACVDIAALLSARAMGRRREMAVRAALGAGRGRLLRQLLTETLLLFLIGAAGGVLLAGLATRALERLALPSGPALVLDLSLDVRVLAFALGVSLLTGLVFGLAPALQAVRRDVTARLREGAAGSGQRRSRASRVLVVGQLAVSLLLLVAAGLFLRALERGRAIDPGFDVAGVATASFDAASWGYEEARVRAFYRQLRQRIEALPGVTAVSYSGFLPLAWGSSGDAIEIAGTAAGSAGGDEVAVELADVAPGYFSLLRMPIVAGRAFTAADDERAANVAVINETLARRHFPEGGALGRAFRFRGEEVTVVGIARDAKYANLGEETPAFVYFPIDQLWRPSHQLLVRTEGDPLRLAPALAAAVRAIDPALPRPEVISLEEVTRVALLPQRVAAGVTGALGGVGLLLTAVGLYGMIAFAASRRTREIGVRMAFGARRADVLGLIVGEGLRLAGLGVLLGLLLAAAATRVMAGLLLGVSPLDAGTFLGAALLFVGVAAAASYLPARRAAAGDPVAALRAE